MKVYFYFSANQIKKEKEVKPTENLYEIFASVMKSDSKLSGIKAHKLIVNGRSTNPLYTFEDNNIKDNDEIIVISDINELIDRMENLDITPTPSFNYKFPGEVYNSPNHCHTLIWSRPHYPYVCDVCDRKFGYLTYRFGCSDCAYDLCMNCKNNEVNKNKK